MAVIKRVITAQEREDRKRQEDERQQARKRLRQRINQAVKLSQADINELVLVLAREHGLIE